jgi:hypothetical protein
MESKRELEDKGPTIKKIRMKKKRRQKIIIEDEENVELRSEVQ